MVNWGIWGPIWLNKKTEMLKNSLLSLLCFYIAFLKLYFQVVETITAERLYLMNQENENTVGCTSEVGVHGFYILCHFII